MRRPVLRGPHLGIRPGLDEAITVAQRWTNAPRLVTIAVATRVVRPRAIRVGTLIMMVMMIITKAMILVVTLVMRA